MIKYHISNILIFFFLCMSVFPQDYKTNKELEVKNNIYYDKVSKLPYTGKYMEFYPDGKVGISGYLKNGLREGEWIWYYENGQKKRYCIFKNGIKHGLTIYYYKNGQKKAEIIFDNDVNIRQTSWDEYGNKIDNPSFVSFQ
ncbi:MAG: hypothetical protein N3A01_01905 [Bacteroidales bacterium]|nr:hypothetical protein [Bacteroidales bacterium]